MHALHAILVNIEDVRQDVEQSDINSYARDIAIDFLEGCSDDVYGWKKNNAGRWLKFYPDSMVVGSENKDRFIKELNKFKDYPLKAALTTAQMVEWKNFAWRTKEQIDADPNLDIISKESDGDLYWSGEKREPFIINKENIYKIWSNEGLLSSDNRDSFMMAYSISMACKLANGDYLFDSQFYSLPDYSAKISEETHNNCKEHPENYVLVLFDLHN